MHSKISDIFNFHRSELNSYNTNAIQDFVKLFNLDIDFTHCILIGGTNGKGSICKILSTIYQESGLKVGLFVSPHLDTYHERIQINSKKISDVSFLQIYEQLTPNLKEAKLKGIHISFFELILISSLIYFKSKDVDIMIYEVGLGGKRDATQILKPNFSAITNVSLDHTHILGGDLNSIADEKSGVIFDQTPFMYAKADIVSSIFKNVSQQKSSPYLECKSIIYNSKQTTQGFEGQLLWNNKQSSFHCSLNGIHQEENLNTALNVIEHNSSFHKVKLEHLLHALATVKHECRLEVVSNDPDILIDGSHNSEGVNQLKKWINGSFKGYQVFICLAFKINKDHSSMISTLQNGVSLLAYTPRHKGFINPRDVDSNIKSYSNYRQIYDDFYAFPSNRKILIFTGSLKSAIIQKKYFKKYKKIRKSTKYFKKD